MTHELVLHLLDPKDLFVFDPATYDPFDPGASDEAGIDVLRQQVRPGWGPLPRLAIAIYLPAAKLGPEIEPKLRVALRAYWERQLAANRQARAEFRADNLLFLVIAVVVAVIGLWLQPRIATTTLIGSGELRNALQTGILVLIWVVFWTPVSGFVLEWVPFTRTARIYRALLAADLKVLPEPALTVS